MPKDQTLRTICLVACAATKRKYPCQAKDLYVSDLFEKSRMYVEQHGWHWYILSAKHHLLDPDKVIQPYEKTLKTMRTADRKQWAREVATQLERVLHGGDNVVFLAGKSVDHRLCDEAGVLTHARFIRASLRQCRALDHDRFAPAKQPPRPRPGRQSYRSRQVSVN